MPRVVDVDAQRDEGAVVFKIGGAYWVAPEPDIDTLKLVVQQDVHAYMAAGKQLRAYVDDPSYNPDNDPGTATMAGVEALIPQLQQLLFAANEAGAYVHVRYTSPEELASDAAPVPEGEDQPEVPRAGVLVPGEVCGPTERTPIPTAWCRVHLSAKRAGLILADVLGEGRAPVAVGA